MFFPTLIQSSIKAIIDMNGVFNTFNTCVLNVTKLYIVRILELAGFLDRQFQESLLFKWYNPLTVKVYSASTNQFQYCYTCKVLNVSINLFHVPEWCLIM